MGTNAITGIDGDVLVGTHVVAEISSWTLTQTAAEQDTTTFDGGRDGTFLPGVISRSGSIAGEWYYGDTAGQQALNDAFSGGTSVTLKLQTAAGKLIQGTAYIIGQDLGADVNGKCPVTFNFRFTGSVTESWS